MNPRDRGRLAVLGAVLFVAACQTNEVEMPDWIGNPVGTVPTGTVITPRESPAPSPAPGTQPTPAPNPTPTPTPPPSSAGCGLPPGGGTGDNCARTSPAFLSAVSGAIDVIVQQHPEYFDLKNVTCANCYKAVFPDAFTSDLVAVLQSRGLCAKYDGEELAVKNTNDFNEQFDVLTADLYLRRGEGSYRATCRPAWF